MQIECRYLQYTNFILGNYLITNYIYHIVYMHMNRYCYNVMTSAEINSAWKAKLPKISPRINYY